MIILREAQVEFLFPLKDLYLICLALLFFISSTIPIIKWKTTPKINTGCKMNCTKILWPIKCDQLLKVSGSITEVRLMVKCCAKNSTRKSPERAIATFRAIEEDSIAIMVLFQE